VLEAAVLAWAGCFAVAAALFGAVVAVQWLLRAGRALLPSDDGTPSVDEVPAPEPVVEAVDRPVRVPVQAVTDRRVSV
jgi:hypothetical protein